MEEEASSAHKGLKPEELIPVQNLLKQWTLAQLLARKPPTTVTCLDADLSVERALKLFAAHDLIAAPVLESDSLTCNGFFDLGDVLRAVCTWFNVQNLSDHNRAERLRAAGFKLRETSVKDVCSANTDGQLLDTSNAAESSLLQVLLDGFLHPADGGSPCHRIAVFDYDRGVGPLGGSLPRTRITHIVTQTDMIKFLAEHIASFPALADLPLSSLCTLSKSVLCVPSDMPAINALAAAYGNRVSSVGIVDVTGNGAMCGCLSVEDLRGIQATQLDLLSLPVMQFVEEAPSNFGRNRHQMSADVYGLKTGLQRKSVPWCHMNSTLREVLVGMAANHWHRMYLLDTQERPVGICTMSDILELVSMQLES